MGSTDRTTGCRIVPQVSLTAFTTTLTLMATVLGVVLAGATPARAAAPPPYFAALGASGDTELQVARQNAVAAPLPDGEILIAGGANGGGYPDGAELFDPASDTFTALPESGATEPQIPRQNAVAAALPDGEVLIAGGAGASGYPRSAELFDPSSDTFTALPESGATELQTIRVAAAAAALPDGQILIADGYGGSGYPRSAELFDPASDTFTALPESGATEPRIARVAAAAAALPDGQILIAGGYDGSTVLAGAELFNPTDDTFTALPESGATELQTARVAAAAAALPDGQILIAGGYDGSTVLAGAELFNPTDDTFTALPESGATELQTAREGAAAAALPDGQVLIAGGYGSSSLQSAELFYSAPQATAAGGEFGDQTVGEPSPVSVLIVTDVGAQELRIAAAALGGADPADFVIAADSCSGRTLAFEQSCTITARFTPAATGARTASIALSDNEPSPIEIALSGTGVAANSGPTGPTGPAGPAGPPGANGTNGTNGAPGSVGPIGPAGANGSAGTNGTDGRNGTDGTNGANGAPGSAGQIELATCKSVTTGHGERRRTVQRCTTRLTSSPVTFTGVGARFAASLSRGRVVYATGSVIAADGSTRLLLSPRRAIGRGSYTLTLIVGRRRRRETIAIV